MWGCPCIRVRRGDHPRRKQQDGPVPRGEELIRRAGQLEHGLHCGMGSGPGCRLLQQPERGQRRVEHRPPLAAVQLQGDSPAIACEQLAFEPVEIRFRVFWRGGGLRLRREGEAERCGQRGKDRPSTCAQSRAQGLEGLARRAERDYV